MNRRASYSVFCADQDFVYIIDQNGPLSVTNGAEAVVAELIPNYPGKRIMYRDSESQWDELCHDGTQFTDFAPGHPPESA
jgi:hypothetical protein